MDSQRIGQSTGSSGYHNQLLHVIGQVLPQRGLALQSEDGRVRWTDRLLTISAILMSWSAGGSMREVFESVRDVVVSMYPSRRRPGRSFEGFIGALEKASDDLVERVVKALRESLRQVAADAWRWRDWAVMAVDGSRVDCPRTAANEEAFGCAGRSKTGPQQYLTTVFHLASGLIWDWRTGRGSASERDHLRQMASGLPRRTLLLMDAGYAGYDLLRAVLEAGHDVIVRAGANVTLLRKLRWFVREQGDIVYLWPLAYRKQEPLILRLVRVHNGRQTVCLLTSVLSRRAMSDAQVALWYRRRWMVEVRYRGLKQTLSKRRMLSDAPHKGQVELDWAVVGLAMLGLMAARQHPQPTARWSVAKTLQIVRGAMRRRHSRVPSGGLAGQLRRALVDNYLRLRPKAARAWPHKKNPPPCRCPIVRMATRLEIRMAQELRSCQAAG
jgi:hypothetical protein